MGSLARITSRSAVRTGAKPVRSPTLAARTREKLAGADRGALAVAA